METKIIAVEQLNERDRVFVFECPEIARAASPGQFVEAKVSAGWDPFLRRPFSIYDAQKDRLKLLVRMVGRGTTIMSSWCAGDSVDLIGPFGNGYCWSGEGEFLLIGGGIGYAPLNFLIRALLAERRKVHLLFSPEREAELIAHLNSAENLKIYVSKDRTGIRPLIDQILDKNPGISKIYSCGPEGMMQMVAAAAKDQGISASLSMEAVMGCGFGICVGCVIPVWQGNDIVYKKVCVDGPVFSGEEVCFHEQ